MLHAFIVIYLCDANKSCGMTKTGGYGTLEELLEVITWAQLGIHDKPVKPVFRILMAYLFNQ